MTKSVVLILFHIFPDTAAPTQKNFSPATATLPQLPKTVLATVLLPSPVYLFHLHMGSLHGELGQPGSPVFLIPPEVAPLRQMM